MRHMRAVMFAVTMSRNMMHRVFVYWSDVLARLMSWTIAG